MASADLLLVLLEAGIALTLALLLVLSLRLPARRWLGARAAYVLWLALAAAALAVLLPRGVEVPLAVPVALALLSVNIAFGVLSRAASQLNPMAIGLPVSLLVGLMLLMLLMRELEAPVRQLFEDAFATARALTG